MFKVKLIDKKAKLPSRKNELDAGYDIHSIEHILIPVGRQAVIRTGIVLVEAPKNCILLLWSKSGLDTKQGLHVGAGVVDEGYRGEILVLLKNTGRYGAIIEPGQAIAQMLIVPVLRPDVEEGTEEGTSERGATGGITKFNRGK